MQLILMGPPGVGKGSQASVLSKKLNIPHISTGDMFRKHFKENTSLGKLAKSYTDKGLLVPDEVTNQMVEDRFLDSDIKNGFLLDGFPRNLAQAKFLDELFERKGIKLTAAVDITADDKVLVKRITGRRVCPTCGAVYHIDNNPPKVAGLCDNDSTPLIQRADDKEETVLNRLKVYKDETFPIIEYYQNQNLVYKVDGMKSIDEVTQTILKALGE
ncbi:Adenylate kinase (ATP-AMP transphosphorylase) [Alteracholeplasma palmae J233]|uniref:Adenylate kinase n=1 Tax=Alteracholeplasma palmae (strain ATCC 49389 / J233) TaxID=1318466 RepID=U4KSC2_ALTPJ|nr:adenylate kinase [Alteracholeplasma palmae]CCV64906.1 Adenylate kinase (ATP-AMP transphosphorylase) [Alteracholeplasma palmae J233]